MAGQSHIEKNATMRKNGTDHRNNLWQKYWYANRPYLKGFKNSIWLKKTVKPRVIARPTGTSS